MKQIELMKVADIIFDNKLYVTDIMSKIAEDFTSYDFVNGIVLNVANAERVLGSIVKSYTSLLITESTNKLSDILKYIRKSLKTIFDTVFSDIFSDVEICFTGRNNSLTTTVEYTIGNGVRGSIISIV